VRFDIPRRTLLDLFELTALIARRSRGRFSRLAERWLLKRSKQSRTRRSTQPNWPQTFGPLGGRRHEQALTALRVFADQRPLRFVR
jgi:hypothetical protein